MVYYNEYEPGVVAWLKELIREGLIADGVVDDRSILDVDYKDLKGFKQHHFFAGIGVWSLALRQAGWADDKKVCTASLPCQPFSVAGTQKGKEDARHLLPHFMQLVRQCKFDTIFGEQVESSIRHGWLDDLQTNMEAEGYAIGHCVLGAHSIHSPHTRQRLYWVAQRVANTGIQRQSRQWEVARPSNTETSKHRTFYRTINASRLDNELGEQRWANCGDGKQRLIEPSIEPVVDGATKGVVCGRDTILTPNKTQEARILRLKGYGNAIQAEVAEIFIRAYDETKKSSS